MVTVHPPANDREQMWQDWAAMAQRGDAKTYASLLRDIVPYIRSVAAPRLANRDWVDDVVQEVLISVHKSLKTYSPDRPFKPWLFAIIAFRVTDFLRGHYAARANRHVSTDNQDFITSHVTAPDFAGEWRSVEDALGHFPEKQRQAFIMMRVEGYSAQEVAERMGMTESAVKVSVHRTGNKLKAMLGQETP